MVTLQEQRQHDVGLLEHLEAVDHQRVVVQQQRPLVRRGVLQVPHLPVEEVRVLRVDAGAVVVRDRHRLGRRGPLVDLARIQIPGDRPAGRTARRRSSASRRDDLGGLGQVEPRHHVGEQVVVDHRGVLVRARSRRGCGRCGPPVGHARSRQNPRSAHIRAVSTRMSTPSRRMKSSSPVALTYLHQRVRDVGVDVVLRGAGRVVGGRLLAVDRPPREQRAALGQVLPPAGERRRACCSGTAARCAPSTARCR